MRGHVRFGSTVGLQILRRSVSRDILKVAQECAVASISDAQPDEENVLNTMAKKGLGGLNATVLNILVWRVAESSAKPLREGTPGDVACVSDLCHGQLWIVTDARECTGRLARLTGPYWEEATGFEAAPSCGSEAPECSCLEEKT